MDLLEEAELPSPHKWQKASWLWVTHLLPMPVCFLSVTGRWHWPHKLVGRLKLSRLVKSSDAVLLKPWEEKKKNQNIVQSSAPQMQNKKHNKDKQNSEQLLPALSIVHSVYRVSQRFCTVKEWMGPHQVVRRSRSSLSCTYLSLCTELVMGRSSCFSLSRPSGTALWGWTSSRGWFSLIPLAFTWKLVWVNWFHAILWRCCYCLIQ